jgi:hypothetical protein
MSLNNTELQKHIYSTRQKCNYLTICFILCYLYSEPITTTQVINYVSYIQLYPKVTDLSDLKLQ